MYKKKKKSSESLTRITRTFYQRPFLGSLTAREYGLDENAHFALWRIGSAHYAETQRFVSGTLVERHRQISGAHAGRRRWWRWRAAGLTGQNPIDDGHGGVVLFAAGGLGVTVGGSSHGRPRQHDVHVIPVSYRETVTEYFMHFVHVADAPQQFPVHVDYLIVDFDSTVPV